MIRDDAHPSWLSSRPRPLAPSLLAQLEAYWRDLRGARALPVRTEVDSAAIDAVLPWSFVAERVAPQVMRIRVAGQKLSTLLGMEARGMPLCAFFAPEARRVLGPLLDQVLDGPAIVELPLESAQGLLRPRLSARMILLPLADAEGRPSRIIGAILCDGTPGRQPARFAVAAGPQRIEEVAPMVSPATPPRALRVAGGTDLTGAGPSAEPPVGLPDTALPVAPGRAAAFLRLVVDNG